MSNPFKSIPGGKLPQIPMIALDRFGKVIEPGHLVMFHSGEDLIFEVLSAGPVLNPAITGGRAMQVVLRAEFPAQFQPGLPNRGMVIVGETQARMQAKAGKNGQPDKTAVPPEPEELIGGVPAADTPDPDPAHGTCSKCGDEGVVDTTCSDCGVGIYQAEKPTLGDA